MMCLEEHYKTSLASDIKKAQHSKHKQIQIQIQSIKSAQALLQVAYRYILYSKTKQNKKPNTPQKTNIIDMGMILDGLIPSTPSKNEDICSGNGVIYQDYSDSLSVSLHVFNMVSFSLFPRPMGQCCYLSLPPFPIPI